MIVIYRCKDNTYKNAVYEFKTEAVADESNPKFVNRYSFNYKFEEMAYF